MYTILLANDNVVMHEILSEYDDKYTKDSVAIKYSLSNEQFTTLSILYPDIEDRVVNICKI